MNSKVAIATADQVAWIALFAVLGGCSSVAEASRADLAAVVQRDGVAFEVESIPGQVIDRLAANKLVVVGETHHLREHREMLVELLEALHRRGFRQLLLEWPHMADCLVDDFLRDGGVWPGWQPIPGLGGWMVEAIKDFNGSLPVEDQIAVHGIDVNLSDYGGAESFLDVMRDVSRHLGRPASIEALLQGGYQGADSHRSKLEDLKSDLEARRSDLTASWGTYWYDAVTEMVEVELASARVRSLRDGDYDRSVRVREAEMKRLTDLRLAGNDFGTVLNVGGNHAQKAYLKGTSQEWLGDYLAHESAAVGGSAIVLAVTAARIIGSGFPDYTLEASPPNELFRLMNETWPDRIVFLPVDDPVFSSGGIPMNFEGEIHVDSPKRVYDVFVLLALAHREM